MNSFRLKDMLATLGAYGGLLGGLLLLTSFPLVGVLIVLGAMALLLKSVANLCEAQVTPREIDAENDARA